MSDKERYEVAKAYVDKQLRTMEQNGLQLTRISQHEYDAMVEQIAQIVRVSNDSNRAAGLPLARTHELFSPSIMTTGPRCIPGRGGP